jgi:hypothetical protein
MGTMFWSVVVWGPLVVGLTAAVALVVLVAVDYTSWLRKQGRV